MPVINHPLGCEIFKEGFLLGAFFDCVDQCTSQHSPLTFTIFIRISIKPVTQPTSSEELVCLDTPVNNALFEIPHHH